jgi:carboxypeptidase C (cathepsin A)
VCIDPVSTGFSRSDDPKDTKLFHGLEEDTHAVGEFIRAYVAKYGREASPTFVAGESYGTTRAASLSNFLQNKGGVKLAGIILISAVLDFQTIRFEVGNDLPYGLYLPTYTASAWHHNKLDKGWARDLASALKEAEKFANGAYAHALLMGNQLSDLDRTATAKLLAKYTGLSEEFVLKSDLRIETGRFRSELLREAGEVIGRLDARVKAKAGGGTKGGAKGGGGGDPSNSLIFGLYTEAMQDYMPNVLKYKTDLKYNISGQVNPWNYGKAGTNRYVTVAPRLRAALEKDKKLRVFVANGYTDHATPFGGMKYTLAHMGPRTLTDRVTMGYYDAGHMMYAHLPSLRQLRDEFAKFITSGEAKGLANARLFSPQFPAVDGGHWVYGR